VNSPVFPDGEMCAAYRPDSDGAARLAVDAQWRSEFGLPRVAPDVENVSSLRLARKIDQMQNAAFIKRRLRLYPAVRDSKQFYSPRRLQRRLQICAPSLQEQRDN
jgi:hypothetical protein